ncbi:MerR family DNA-binding transcriptional regulator [Leucobacter ruminantium]|uniref:Redoxin family protein n=1 Tax=Leucobacter ruminantium TaxID=1289170 RepID=A0A939RVF4_9MICO|nr:MerR family DNA-binding transcriptional regulator [Leucobacter ruminantium]MBO1803902.1 redoxin family protein [Leucobacter ruminantium]
MRIGELAQRSGVSTKAIRYYERLGLLSPVREENGYRSFSERDARVVSEIRELSGLGIAPSRARPFVECLDAGHEHGDECVSSLAVYRDAIAEIDRVAAELTRRRAELQERLDAGASRTFDRSPPPDDRKETRMTDYTILPEGLPVPEDDGAARHLPGLALPPLELATSDGGSARLDELGSGRTVIYLYPLTGRPGVDLPDGWDAIPGARGCSTEACDFRDHFSELHEAGAARVFGMSSQSPSYQAEVVDRLRLPFPMLSDVSLALADALRLPTFAAEGHDRLYSRLTLVVADGAIEHVFYPIFPPNTHAQQVLAWLQEHPRTEGGS